jgi:8-oxo-dGTP pyrophosphatase MutT (NUDIX family)
VGSIPKPAATVVLIDHLNRVYLTKRPKTMKFLGGFYVFPGGSVELEDEDINEDYIINEKDHEAFSPAHYIAAARELFEEVGILLANHDDGSFAKLKNETEWEYRRQLLNGDISFTQILMEENLYFDFNHLTYFGHRITPKESPIRFDTRFFIAKLPTNQSPKPEESEIDDAFWMNPSDVLAAYHKGKMPLVPPTIDSLETILNHQKGGALMMGKQKPKKFPFKT